MKKYLFSYCGDDEYVFAEVRQAARDSYIPMTFAGVGIKY